MGLLGQIQSIACLPLLAAGWLSHPCHAALAVEERDGAFSIVRDGAAVIRHIRQTSGSPKPENVRSSFETAPDGSKVWNRWCEEPEGRFRMEVVQCEDGSVEITALGEGLGITSNRFCGLSFEVPRGVFDGLPWRAFTGNGRRRTEGSGVFDESLADGIRARWLTCGGLTFDFNPRGPIDYMGSCDRNAIRGVWRIRRLKGGECLFDGGASYPMTYGGYGGTKVVIREGDFGDYRRLHFLDAYHYGDRLETAVRNPAGLVAMGATVFGRDYEAGDEGYSGGVGRGWVGNVIRKRHVGHRSGAYYAHVAGSGEATYRFAGLADGFYVATIQIGNYTGTRNRFSVSVNGEPLGRNIVVGKRKARTISRGVHVRGGVVDFTFSGDWIVSAIGLQPLMSEAEDFAIHRGFWYVEGYEPSVMHRSAYYGAPLAPAVSDETIDMPVPGTETSAAWRDPPAPVELPDSETASLAWMNDARMWKVMENYGTLLELSDDAWREQYVTDGLAGKNYNVAMINGMLSRHTYPAQLQESGQREVAKLARTFHAHGMNVLDHLDLTLLWNCDIGNRVLMERLPEVMKDKFNNLPGRHLCMNSPSFKQWMFDQLRWEVQNGVDGFQLDEGTFWMYGCTCRNCRERFTAETGWVYPLDETDPTVTGPCDTPLARRWLVWRARTINTWLVELRRFLKDVKPDLVLSAYTTQRFILLPHSRRLDASNIFERARACNYFGVEVMMRNVLQGARAFVPLQRMMNIFTQSYGTPVWAWFYNDDRNVDYFAWAVANMCGQSALLGDFPPDPDFPDYRAWGASAANMKRESVGIAQTAILFSAQSRDWNEGVKFEPEMLGLAQELEALHVPYEFIHETSLNEKGLAKYKALFLGASQCLSDENIEAIKVFASHGGRVFLTADVGTRNEIGERRPAPAFAAELAAKDSAFQIAPSAASFYAPECSPPETWRFEPDLAAEAEYRTRLAEMMREATFWEVRNLPDRVYTALWREKKTGALCIHFLNATGANIRPGERMTTNAPSTPFPPLADDIHFVVPATAGTKATAASPDFSGERDLAVRHLSDGRLAVTLSKDLLRVYTLVRIGDGVFANPTVPQGISIDSVAIERSK